MLLTSKFFQNFVSLSVVNAANMLLPLLTVPYVTRIIGPNHFGELNYSHALVGYFVLVINYGFDLSASKRIAAVRDNKVEVNSIFSTTLQVKFLLFLISTFIFAVIINLNPSLNEGKTLHWITYLSTIGHVAYPTWLFQGMEKLSRTAIINLIIKLLFTALIFILIQQPSDFIYQNLAVSVAHTIGGLIALFMAVKQFNIRIIKVSWNSVINTLREGSVTFYYTMINTLYTATNIIILQLTSNQTSVGYFSAAYRVDMILRSFILVAFGQSIFPIVARSFEKNSAKAITQIQAIIPLVFCVTATISLSTYFFSERIILTLFGNKFQETATILRIIAILPILVSLNYVYGVLTMMNLNYRRQFAIITTITSLNGLLFNYFLSIKYHHIGTSISLVGTELLTLIILITFLHKQNVFKENIFTQNRGTWTYIYSKLKLKFNLN